MFAQLQLFMIRYFAVDMRQLGFAVIAVIITYTKQFYYKTYFLDNILEKHSFGILF
jgi:hypothetical protein